MLLFFYYVMTRKYLHKNENFKISAVNYSSDILLNKTKIVKIFNCGSQNLINWVRQFKKTGLLSRKKNKFISYR